MMPELKTVDSLYENLKKRTISSVEVTKYYLERIDSLDKKLNSVLLLTPQVALDEANRADQMIATDQPMCWLTGVPYLIKDTIVTKDIKTTAGSKVLKDFIPPYNATVIDRLDSVYAPKLGKTNLDEFAMGSTTENSAYNPVLNPWDSSRVPGGSSGGSAAAVAAGLVPFALGSDTGGSIRQPAGFCGVVGLKPTYGRVSRYGLIAYGSSLDCIGPITRTVKDSAYVLNIISGFDSKDSTSQHKPIPDYSQRLAEGIRGMKIALPKEYFVEGLDAAVKEPILKAVKMLEKMGAEIVEVSLPHSEYAISTYYLTATSEASSNLGRYNGVVYGEQRDEFGEEVKKRIILGTYALSAGYYDAFYLKASKVRDLIKQDFDKAFSKVDCLISPVAPSLPYKLGEKSNPLQMYLSDIYTISANLAGIPAISLPCGVSDGLPVGMQILGPHFGEESILRVAYSYEQETKWYERMPKL